MWCWVPFLLGTSHSAKIDRPSRKRRHTSNVCSDDRVNAIMASHNNGTKKFSSIPTKSDSSQFSKRKKDLENTKEGSCNVSSRKCPATDSKLNAWWSLCNVIVRVWTLDSSRGRPILCFQMFRLSLMMFSGIQGPGIFTFIKLSLWESMSSIPGSKGNILSCIMYHDLCKWVSFHDNGHIVVDMPISRPTYICRVFLCWIKGFLILHRCRPQFRTQIYG